MFEINFFLKIINPFSIIKAIIYHKSQKKYRKSRNDLELMLYSKIITNDMLHYGYFNNIDIPADEISIKKFQDAQNNYVKIIMKQIKSYHKNILDVGCGMGGLSKILLDNEFKVESLTPDNNQYEYINSKYTDLTVHHMKYEEFSAQSRFDVIINSESLQYINLEKAFHKSTNILKDNGIWIIIDYFRIHDKGVNKSGHLLSDFIKMTDKNKWEIISSKDITKNILPTLKFATFIVKRFINPLGDFVLEKVRVKYSWFYYLIQQYKNDIKLKRHKEMSALDPAKFSSEKKYMLYVLKKRVNYLK